MSTIRVFQIAVRVGWGMGEIRNFTERGEFLTGWNEPGEKWFWQFEPFSKLKVAFRECWTSIKIKINITCVSKGYKIKTKMEQKQWLQLKMLFLLGYDLKNVVYGEGGRTLLLLGDGIEIWWRGDLLGGIFLGGEGRSKFSAGVGGTPHSHPPSPLGKTLTIENGQILL